MGDGPPCFRRDSSCPAVLRIRAGGNKVSTTGLLPPMAGLSRPLRLPRSFVTPYGASYNPERQAFRFGLLPFRSPLLRKSLLLSSPPGTEMFQFPGLPSIPYVFRYGYHPITDGGFPHSDIPGSMPAYGSPRRFAVRRVLLRLLVPRHPPCALTHLTLD